MRRWLIALSLLAVFACDDTPPARFGPPTTMPPAGDGGPAPRDATPETDAGDAATPDAHGDLDAGLIDVGTASASDAGPRDATPEDGAAADAMTLDAHLADATPGDAQLTDASAGPDAQAGDAQAGDAQAGDAQAGDAQAGDASAGPDAGASDAGLAPDTGAVSGGLCGSSRDCVPGEACGALRVLGGMITTSCTSTNSPPAGPIGDPCMAGAECVDGLCLGSINGECSVVCSDAALDCPTGFGCVGFQYNPGPVTVRSCARTCQRNLDCNPGASGNVCSTQAFEVAGQWQLALICEAPAGPGDLGQPCPNGGGDCRSGLCLTSSRGSCTGPAGCAADETCQCANGAPPPCAGGGGATCVSISCTSPCAAASDCTSSFAGNRLTSCAASVTFTLPDMTQASVRTCTRP